MISLPKHREELKIEATSVIILIKSIDAFNKRRDQFTSRQAFVKLAPGRGIRKQTYVDALVCHEDLARLELAHHLVVGPHRSPDDDVIEAVPVEVTRGH